MKVAVLETIDHPGVPSDITLASRVYETVEHRCHPPGMAGRNHGSWTHDRGVHHGNRCAELHFGATRRRGSQHWSSIVHETIGTFNLKSCFLNEFIPRCVAGKMASEWHRGKQSTAKAPLIRYLPVRTIGADFHMTRFCSFVRLQGEAGLSLSR